jgi:hypothetical protein
LLSKSRIFKFLKRDCGTIPVAEITSGKIEIFSKHQRFLIATESSKYLLIFVLYVCVILCEFGTAKKKFVTQSRTGLQIYEGHDDQLNRQGPMA